MSDLEAVRHMMLPLQSSGGKLRSLANSSIKQPAVEGLDGPVFAHV